MPDEAGRSFKRVVRSAAQGTVIKPLLQAYLYDARFPSDFSVRFKNHEMNRDPDGRFHPSTHPLWPERMLWYYFHRPDQIIPEVKDYMGAMSITVGHAMHSFIEMCLQDMGVLCTREELEALGFPISPKTGEASVSHPETRSGGNVDGVTTPKVPLPQAPDLPHNLFEYKTSNAMTVGKLTDLDLDAFKAKWPEYYAQAQEYLRISGFSWSIVVVQAMGYPWEIREFHIPHDPGFSQGVARKYLRVIEATEVPDPCCSPLSKEATACPARMACPVGQASLSRPSGR